MDLLTKNQRSWNMSRILSKNTKPEILVRKYLYANGIHYRIHANLPGKPDIVVSRRKTAIFVNGCFWHGHLGCKYFRWPKTKVDYWYKKINGNLKRDAISNISLKKRGWHVLVIWECELRKNQYNKLQQLYSNITRVKYSDVGKEN